MSDICQTGLDIGFASLSYAQIAFLGVVQGITELLPISSTAHMRVVPALLGWRDPGSAFSAAMQMAALAAVISYFWRDVSGVTRGSLAAVRQRDFDSPDFLLAVMIVLATIPICIAGLLLAPLLNACDSPLRGLSVIGYACLAMAALLALAERICRHNRDISQMRLRDALIVGIAQVGALIPGVSRSGSTLTAAMFLNLRREEAARFSFLLGLPAIALAGLKELVVLWHAHIPAEAWSLLLVGLLVASLSAFAAIWGLMRFLERFSTWPFIIYRALLGIFLLIGVHQGLFA
ncbi:MULTISPECIES: undecaprenyl-diphosphate phosphatase [Pseudomonadaceae]|uniref:Undecaprenyl-diphosphatase n=2 Tax=Pseudomonadaceae TaxID=135621 RepID=A0A1G5PG83_9PSED|nr:MULTISPECIES: undecaprenyl-diphosphate phosphatase [Pseudomonas]KIZ52256.1 UDP pyrophosphate phosphatase [Pseudomonas oryzihabitans]MBA1258344.1 undecaprenyl-diphosphate phosphatase [Pseudomonas psychrotolerans]MDU4059569.1 undecaprenyl-diphosphate phosphatase [Pseudomonas oryzihabitans]NMY87818.1 undecaprenyl-diphosphate phosphatase [Pseudomonas psychrotolerans]NMZ44762.1 undecaprenyl-diphosphate phosphatase [Pseudomonas oryzihabitans]